MVEGLLLLARMLLALEYLVQVLTAILGQSLVLDPCLGALSAQIIFTLGQRWLELQVLVVGSDMT